MPPEDLSMSWSRTTLALIAAPALIPALLIGAQVAPSDARGPEPPEVAGDREQAAPRERTGRIYLADGKARGHLVSFDPGNGDRKEHFAGCNTRPRVSPDGRLVAYEWEGSIWVRDLEGGGEPKQVLDLGGAAFGTPPVWSHDGRQLIVSLGWRDEERNHWRFETYRINADGTGKEELKIPHEDGVQDWSSDGSRLVTTSSRGAQIGWQLYVMRVDGTDQRQITEGGNPFYTRFSPEGRSVLYSDGTTEERRGIWVVDLADLSRRKVLSTGKALASACWSPDGQRIAVVVYDWDPMAAIPQVGRLVVMNVDGSNPLEFRLDDIPNADMPDWR
jgi:Tol biopolymer transport system component